ncbi:hypothetical protein B0I27_10799 [Arcticibacter pallidicorallinus]|uniref:Uncharacterized protein n=1 Tax=Arcticibacter pallidicorallinus TaxID=1259464 RepID=A0A2T0U0U2_9SPHI|nr:hypothetical protein [Arcticibacter pallidicorallinus]PRY51513.1 hypothetical protein B0I27_10799 [Arcticibacter pallidicorallinus]
MRRKQPPNPYTAHGRRRILQEAREFNKTLPEKDVEQAKMFGYLLVFGAFVIIGLLLLLIGGWDLVKFWLTPKGAR